jgi:cytidylate kinase
MLLVGKTASYSMVVHGCICSDEARLTQLAEEIEHYYIPYITGTNAREQLVNISRYLLNQIPSHCIEAVQRKFVQLKAQQLAQKTFTIIEGKFPDVTTKVFFDGSVSHYIHHSDGTEVLIRQLPATRDWNALTFEKLIREYSIRKGQQSYLFDQEARSPEADSVTSDASDETNTPNPAPSGTPKATRPTHSASRTRR